MNQTGILFMILLSVIYSLKLVSNTAHAILLCILLSSILVALNQP